jgi:hypothetical protein
MYLLGLEEVQEHKITVQVSIGTGGDARWDFWSQVSVRNEAGARKWNHNVYIITRLNP